MKVSKGSDWQVFIPTRPRVFHLGGDCGYHAKKQTCNIEATKTTVKNLIHSWSSNLFPASLHVSTIKKNFPTSFKGGSGNYGNIVQ